MSDSDETGPFAGERSMLASMGARRSWFSRDRDPEEADPSEEEEAELEGPSARSMLESLASHAGPQPAGESGPSEADEDDGPFARSMLGSLASQAGPQPPEETVRPSLLALERAPTTPAERPPGAVAPIAHSTLAELAGLEEHATSAFPIERAILISLFAHLVLLILLIVVPVRTPATEGNIIDTLAAAMQTPKDDSPIPVNFRDLPGAARENPKRSPLSDADRRAGGGDPARPKSDTPFVPRSPGITGLAPGPRAPRVPGGPAQAQGRDARSAAQAEAERRAAPDKADASAERKASEFPADMRPSLSNGPREVTKLAGLDAAIREAARGTVGGEGGAPMPNEEGGFVDVGGVSFETSWYDWGPYAAEMLRRIKLHWRISRDLLLLQQNGNTQIAFSIMADGSVADVRVQRPSTIPPYTHGAMQAILESDPFRPLPRDLLQMVPGKDRERIVINFIYFPTQEQLDGYREPR